MKVQNNGNPDSENDSAIGKLLNKYDSLEKRISLIEARMSNQELVEIKTDPEPAEEFEMSDKQGINLEEQIGSQGLAWLGNIVLVLGIMFLMSLAQNKGHSLLSSLVGFSVAGILFFLAHKFRRSLSNLVFMLNFGGFILAYYVTLKLHFFTPEPLISNMFTGLALVLILLAALLWFSIRKKSELFGTISIIFIILTGLFSSNSYVTLSLLFVAATVSAGLFHRKEWNILLMVSLFLVYLGHLIWLLGNPIISNSLGIVDFHQYNVFFLFSYAGIYALLLLAPPRESIKEKFYTSLVIWNAVLFLLLIIMVVLAFYEENYGGIFAAISILCLGFSVFLHIRGDRKFIPELFASFGFMALSVSVYGYTGLPNAHLLLALQSLLVVSIAIWYRSRIIIIVNTFLFLFILLVYLIAFPSVDIINIAFALVAIASARILNWKKERLTLRTDGLRNLYLVEAFIMVLFSLHQALPDQYITLSWTLAAGIYVLMSIVLRNYKYRWMAIATFIATAIYLFLVDLSSLQIGYRVMAFLFLAVISLAASVYYSKRIRNDKPSQED